MPALPNCGFSSLTQHTPPIRATATIAKKKELVKGVHELINTNNISRTAGADTHSGFDDRLDPYMHAGVKENDLEGSSSACE